MKKTLSFLFLTLFFIVVKAQTPAFPGAEGHGRYTTGGRGGTVYYVTTLEDNNSKGSLRYAITRSGIRTILFKVSGTIQLNSELKINNGNVTIAGQSAPGDGICIAGFPVMVNADNVIIRYIRCRMGDLKDVNADGADAMGGRRRKRVILDHCSISWCTDECASFYENENFTMQWCLISESLRLSGHSKGAHGYGAIWGGQGASFHHNLLAHHDSRVPRLGPGVTTTATNELVDMRNNVFYNYNGNGCYGAEAMHVNIVNNYFKPGPANTNAANSAKRGRIVAIDKKTDNSFPAIEDIWGTFYIDGNVIYEHEKATKDNWNYGVYNQFHTKYGTISQKTKDTIRLAEPLDAGYVTTHSAEKAYEQVLKYVGCSYKRDALDARIVEEARTNKATFIGSSSDNSSPYPRPGIIDTQNDIKPSNAGSDWSPWPELLSGSELTDTNNDGIPDGWLETNYPDKKADDVNEEGYTYLEVYLNSLVDHITTAQNEGGISSGINKEPETAKPVVHCYINRADNNLHIYSENGIERVNVYNLAGIRQITKKCDVMRRDEIDLSCLSGGVYLVQVYCSSFRVPSITKIIR